MSKRRIKRKLAGLDSDSGDVKQVPNTNMTDIISGLNASIDLTDIVSFNDDVVDINSLEGDIFSSVSEDNNTEIDGNFADLLSDNPRDARIELELGAVDQPIVFNENPEDCDVDVQLGTSFDLSNIL